MRTFADHEVFEHFYLEAKQLKPERE